MNQDKRQQQEDSVRGRVPDRRERLGMALRANLRKRKQQIRKRRDGSDSDGFEEQK